MFSLNIPYLNFDNGYSRRQYLNCTKMNYTELLEQACAQINEIMPWDLDDYLSNHADVLMIDVRETHEYNKLRIDGALTVPRGILESACSWGFNETVPELANAQNRAVLVICRSGHRSAFAALSMQQLGFKKVTSLKLGLKGLNDEDHPIINAHEEPIDADLAEDWLNPSVLEAQLSST